MTVDEITTPEASAEDTGRWMWWQPMRWSGPATALAGGAAVVVVVVVAVLVGWFASSEGDEVGDDPDPTVTTTLPAVEESAVPFDIAWDKFCEWFTAEDLNRIVADAQATAGTDYDFEDLEADGCWGTVRSAYWGTPRWTEGTGIPGALMIGIKGPSPRDRQTGFRPHEMLDPSVTFALVRYAVAYDAGLNADLSIEGRYEPIGFLFGVGDPDAVLTDRYEALGLAIANRLLEEMHWITPERTTP